MRLVIYAEHWKAMIVNAEQERKPPWVAVFTERDGYDPGATLECLRHARNLQLKRYTVLAKHLCISESFATPLTRCEPRIAT